jgi:predicted helicase
MTEFEKYFKSLQSQKISDITEHSHRPALKTLVESFIASKVKVLHEPKREGKFGSPDFKITHTESIIGYIENKKIEENLDKTIKSDQIKKYQALSDNILITNYIDWIWIKGGEIQKRETLCYITDIESKKAKLDKTKADAVEKLIKGFLSQAPKEIADAKKLAEELAIRAKLLKDFLLDELKRQQEENTDGRLFQLYETFRSFIFHELTISEFSDAFAQNLVYGLFLAKLNADTQTVNLYNAKKFIPASFELIKELVNFLDELDNDEYRETRWIVEEVLTIMNNLDLRAIQDSLSFTKRRKDANNFTIKDPYVYFYENFLAAYDKKLRAAKGVYYTPPPVVNFIVRAINDILKDTFKIKEGLGDKNKVTVLDFATGTGTFLVEMLQQIFEKLPKDSGKKDLIIKEHVLKNIFGFEYLIAPYTIAHLKLSQFLKDNGYELKAKERLQVYLTNTLEPIPAQIKIPLLPALTEESKQAQEVKDKPILVITGNPPYSGHSKNNGAWITDKIKDYHFVDGKPLGEKNPKWLQDDYVKFIRFAQDKMETVEEGVVGIITNHRFLTNPTFRGMRQSLMKTFDQIYLIDLHGSNKPKEIAPDGRTDENVFDIEQGVAISLFVKRKGIEKKIWHTDFWGTRLEKYQRSLEDDLKSIDWKEVKATAPFYLLTPQDEKLKKQFFKLYSIDKIFQLSCVGVATSRDAFVVDFDKDDLLNRIKDFIKPSNTSEYLKDKYGLKENSKFKIDKSRAKLSKLKNIELENLICNYHYRAFDVRKLIYEDTLLERPRKEVMVNFQDNNIAIITNRQVKTDYYSHTFVTEFINDLHIIETAYANPYTYPLYILRNGVEKTYFGVSEPESFYKTENFTKDFRKYIDKHFQHSFSPEEIFGYIYAILHSPTYRNKYSEFLKTDFPRIPFTDDKKVFKQLSELGNELISVHLLKEPLLDDSLGEFIGKGNSVIEKPNYVVEKKIGKLYINKTQYFNNVPQQVYDFILGGYQVIDKYLKDRKDRKLTYDEAGNVEKTIRAIAFTIEQMNKIDKQTKNWI